MDYIRSLGEFSYSGNLLIYGVGSRGKYVYEQLGLCCPQAHVLGFLDSCTVGTFLDVPVFPLNHFVKKRSGKLFQNVLILVASHDYREVAAALLSHGIENVVVFLSESEEFPYTLLSTEHVIKRLAHHPHPLVVAKKQQETGDGIHYSCNSFDNIYFRPTGISPCCWVPDVVKVGSLQETLDRCNKIIKEFIGKAQTGENTFCLRCPSLCRSDSPFEFKKFRSLSIDISTKCNLKCSYCYVKGTASGVDYDIEEVIEYAFTHGYLQETGNFSWGGLGEPTINPSFERLTEKLIDKNWFGMIFTNCVKFSNIIEKGLRGNSVRIWPSIDAGTRETYEKVRGADKFDQVWTHLEKYIQANPANVIVKYIVTDDNYTLDDIEPFVERCKGTGVESILFSKDFYGQDVSENIKQGLVSLTRLCRQYDIKYEYLKTAISQDLVAEITQRLA